MQGAFKDSKEDERQQREEDAIMAEKEAKKTRGKKKALDQKKETVGVKEVEFSFFAPEAREVFLAGEFNQWNTRSLPMRKDPEGVWRLTVELNPGNYEFKFWVDGSWFEDLAGAQLVSNSFGTQNYVVGV